MGWSESKATFEFKMDPLLVDLFKDASRLDRHIDAETKWRHIVHDWIEDGKTWKTIESLVDLLRNSETHPILPIAICMDILHAGDEWPADPCFRLIEAAVEGSRARGKSDVSEWLLDWAQEWAQNAPIEAARRVERLARNHGREVLLEIGEWGHFFPGVDE